jgi:hypothetical protein
LAVSGAALSTIPSSTRCHLPVGPGIPDDAVEISIDEG